MGRWVVIAAGILGIGAILGYGISQSNERNQNQAQASAQQAVEIGPARSTTSIPELVARSARARNDLDVAILTRVSAELATAAEATTTVPKTLEAQRERLDVVTTLAVEATVRGSVLGDAAARRQAEDYVSEGNALVDELQDALDPGQVLATRARLALAGGDDVISTQPAVLLPTYRDRELQNVLLAEPLWHAEFDRELDDTDRSTLIEALEGVPDPSALERMLLALALPDDQSSRAQALVREVLVKAPGQPLAQGLLARLRGEVKVAMADPIPVGLPEDTKVDLEPLPEDTKIDPQPEPLPVDTKTDPDPPVDTKVEPKPDKPKPEPKPEPKPDKPKPEPKPDKPKPEPKPQVDLADEGCKLVHGGKAEQGFAMLQKAFDQDPRDTKVTLCMAEGHMKLGRLPSARAMVERVLRSSGKNKKALGLAAKIEDQMGNKRAAADYYRKLLELEPDNATAQAYVDKNG
ncbi:tetratricopeptide repeat protein [Paraliomyxa miuraensis]|uniref:tetratricopeptide repeat protein n=1 Tax=Paraliomyxa miuraensis TaxID=376150 RepID=UPI0022559921|nr:tetratricopeptide repeat protein [Paraliomyxa miuraensis]MCX4242083.1 hypothetical protein [Paraliomyxa miuraensis]